MKKNKIREKDEENNNLEIDRNSNRKTKKVKKRRGNVNEFIDDQASEDGDDDSNEVEREDPNAEFYREQYRKKNTHYDDLLNRKPEDLVRDFEGRVREERRQKKISSHFIPSLKDPKLFSIRCKRGAEKDTVLSIANKYNYLKGSKGSIEMISASAIDKTPGSIYIEAVNKWHIEKICKDIKHLDDRFINVNIIRSLIPEKYGRYSNQILETVLQSNLTSLSELNEVFIEMIWE